MPSAAAISSGILPVRAMTLAAVDEQRQRKNDSQAVEESEPAVRDVERVEDIGPGCAARAGHDAETGEGHRNDDQDRA